MGTLGRPTVKAPMTWLRGAARHEGGYIILEDPEKYSLYENVGTVFDLADVEDVAGCVAFASRYGLLMQGSPDDLREPVTGWLDVAGTLHSLLEVGWFYRKATLAGDAEAIQELWDHFYQDMIRPRFAAGSEHDAINDHELLYQTSIMLSDYINAGMQPTRLLLSSDVEWDDAPQWGFRFVVEVPTLLASIYHEFATMMMRSVEMLRCPHCGRFFVPVDSRQRYCSPACSNRARYQRFAQKQRESAGELDAS